MDYFAASLEHHRETQGKIEVRSRMRLDSMEALSLAYTPGVARPCEVISEHPSAAWDLTWKGRTVAVVSDGSAVLGLGNLGGMASLPVMEGKAGLFREFGGVDAVPVVLGTQDEDEIISVVRAISPTYGGINLEDISAPRCFRIEAALQDLGIPVLHDDQHGTAIVVLAALVNASRITGTSMRNLSVVINGAGAAGHAIARLLCCRDEDDRCIPVGKIRICDSQGVIAPSRKGLNSYKAELAEWTNPDDEQGDLRSVLRGANVFIGVSCGDLLATADIRTMAPDPIILAMANPTPEISPASAAEAGARIIGTGRSDYPNQVNNVLAFPGLFRGALQARATRFTPSMKFAAIEAIVEATGEPTPERILPSVLDHSVAMLVGERVAAAARRDNVCVVDEGLPIPNVI